LTALAISPGFNWVALETKAVDIADWVAIAGETTQWTRGWSLNANYAREWRFTRTLIA
jgi:hypothetical protein